VTNQEEADQDVAITKSFGIRGKVMRSKKINDTASCRYKIHNKL